MSTPPLTPASTQRSSPAPYTPTKARILAAPASIQSRVSSSATLIDLTVDDEINDKAEAKKLDAAFALHNYLVKEGLEDFPFPFFATVGQQSSAKSSVLSALLKIPLYSEQGQATHGPTFIHSRHSPHGFEASIEIELARPSRGSPNRLDFTSQKITDLNTLRKALRLAGEEARRIENVSSRMRTYEDIIDIEDGRQSAHHVVTGFTSNVVRLFVSGPEQENISIVDLPGLNGDELVNNLVAEYLAKPECTAIFCHAAGGFDPNPENKDWEMLLKARPSGEGVLGIITKADHIDVSENSPEVKLIKGQKIRDFLPEFGWLPLRLRSAAEREMSDELFLSKQSALFRDAKWAALARSVGKRFGIKAAEECLMEINDRKVFDNNDQLLRKLQQLDSDLKRKMQHYPTAQQSPVGITFDLIREIERSLQTRLIRRADQANALFDLQKAYGSELVQTVPELLPFAKANIDIETHEELAVCGHPIEGRSERLYIDEIIREVKARYIARNGTCDVSDVRLSLIRLSVIKWRDLSLQHIDTVWSLVTEQTQVVLNELCAGKPALKERISQILLDEHEAHFTSSKEVVTQAFEIEYHEDPRDIDDWDGSLAGDHRLARQHFESEYHRLYGGFSADGTMIRAPPDCTPEQLSITFGLMADVTIALEFGAGRWYQTIGRQVQASVLRWLRQIVVRLYKSLEMDAVQEGPAKRLRDYCEPNDEARRERDALLRKKRRLEDIQKRFAR